MDVEEKSKQFSIFYQQLKISIFVALDNQSRKKCVYGNIANGKKAMHTQKVLHRKFFNKSEKNSHRKKMPTCACFMAIRWLFCVPIKERFLVVYWRYCVWKEGGGKKKELYLLDVKWENLIKIALRAFERCAWKFVNVW